MRLGRAAIALVAFACAAGTSGCLSSNDSSPGATGSPNLDAGPSDASGSVLDASGSVDGAGTLPDAGALDGASPVDAALPEAGPFDAGASTQSQVGLVGGGTLGKSAHYALVGTTGPATAPVLHSSSYQIVGGMGASVQKK